MIGAISLANVRGTRSAEERLHPDSAAEMERSQPAAISRLPIGLQTEERPEIVQML
jgi:hypothetical protein